MDLFPLIPLACCGVATCRDWKILRLVYYRQRTRGTQASDSLAFTMSASNDYGRALAENSILQVGHDITLRMEREITRDLLLLGWISSRGYRCGLYKDYLAPHARKTASYLSSKRTCLLARIVMDRV